MPPADAVNDPSQQPTQPAISPGDVRAALCQDIDRRNAQAWEVSENDPGLARQLVTTIRDHLKYLAATGNPYRKGQADALMAQAVYERAAGDYHASIQHSMEALALYQQIGETGLWLFRVYYNLGLTYGRLGDYAQAEEANMTLYEMALAQGDVLMQATALRSIGILHSRLGESREALRYNALCEPLYTQINDLTGLASVYNNMCFEYYSLGEYDTALSYGLRSLPLFEQVGSFTGQSRIHCNLGLIYTEIDQFQAAQRHLEQGIHYADQAQSVFSRLLGMKYLGRLRLRQGHIRAALAATQAALTLAQQTSDRWEEGECCRQLAEVYEAMGDIDQMAAYYKRYVQVYRQLFNEDNLVRLRGVESLWHARQSQHEIETQRRLREQERQQAERLLAMRDEFLDAATHDLKNPLAVIAVAVHRLRHYVPKDNTPAHQTFDRIEQTIIQMRDLIANLLDLSPLQTGYILHPVPTDLVALTRDVVQDFQELADHKRIRLTLDSPLPSLTLPLDPDRMRQALANLLSNAVKYTPADGAITLSISREATGLVTLIVRDTGIGIPADALPHIFERFYRVRSPEHDGIDGSGLGLAITRSIIAQHNGSITVTSAPGLGTTFTITLPTH